MIYGYVRVSTKEQNENRQIDAMEKSKYEIDRIFTEKQSGKNFERAVYMRMLKKIKRGDIIVIKSIDRLGRNYREIIEQWALITKKKGADVVVLDMPILDTTRNKDLLGTFISDLVLQLLSYVAENERANIRQRQAEGIEAAKARGVKFGRPKKFIPENYVDIISRVNRGELTRKQAVAIIGTSNKTYYRIRKALAEKNLS